MQDRNLDLYQEPNEASSVLFTPERVTALRSQILTWYRAHARDLPWRKNRDPYAVWVSEVMLQQTRVDTVIPYFERFLSRWPTVQELAQADPDEVRSMWSGLGYYRRAQSMLRAAQIVAERPDGCFPSDPEELSLLPGFGPYTRGAVASIAFDCPVPAVDGNVSRVLARIAAVEGDPSRGEPSRQIWSLAGQLATGTTPGDLNQGLIELGACVCKRTPECSSCPVKDNCEALQQNRVRDIPAPRTRAKPKPEAWTALVLYDQNRILLARRPEGGRFSSMWCPVLFEGHLSAKEARHAALKSGLGQIEVEARPLIVHTLTHRRMDIVVFSGSLPSSSPTEFELKDLNALDELGLPALTCKLLRSGLPSDLVPASLPGRRSRPSSASSSLAFEFSKGSKL